jgi:glycerol kinase
MNSKNLILAIDQGTTSSRAIIFDSDCNPIAHDHIEFTQHYPSSGWVEHNPMDIWETTLKTCKNAIKKGGLPPQSIAGIGITNQRETTLIWDRRTGLPIYNAIVWQDRRTAESCKKLKECGWEPLIREKTGLLLDPYFSASKIAWILDHVEGSRTRAIAGELAFGTVDCWLLWNLTQGTEHSTDSTNASRTMLYNISTNDWDHELLALFDIPKSLLPSINDCGALFGTTTLFGIDIPILGIAGDQHAAAIGQACFEEGMVKSTYGTGCFALLNTGTQRVASENRLLTTVAYRLDGQTTYALEGSIFIAGAAVQWLRDGLGIIKSASETDDLAKLANITEEVYLVPAFTGLGAPWWDAEARGALLGLTRNTGTPEIAKATLESVCYQTLDLLRAMQADWQESRNFVLRVDGGMSASNWTMQCLADILQTRIECPSNTETTALGAAWLAGNYAGIWPSQEEFSNRWNVEKSFEPKMDEVLRNQKVKGWKQAVQRVLES